jgi:acid stress-induced BolA-like protein IbaG/YrbA
MTNEQKDNLVREFQKEFGEVEVEPVNGSGRYRFTVVSDRFQGMGHLQRQDVLWAVADRAVPREATLDISIILAFTPAELTAA